MNKPDIINKKKKTKRTEIFEKNKTLKYSSSSKSKTRCKKGTKKYKALGLGCFTKEDIENFQLLKRKSKIKRAKPELIIVEEISRRNKTLKSSS